MLTLEQAANERFKLMATQDGVFHLLEMVKLLSVD